MSELLLEEVTYTYPGASSPALRDVTLTISPGELVVVAGGSGSGKSTLLRAISGLVPHFHGGRFGGTARVGGLDTREHGPGELSRLVGTLLQDPETQVVMGTVRAELSFGLENRGWPAAAIARGVEEAALALGIQNLLDRSTADLSGGEMQRVALGAALAGRPSVIVLDEPTSQLDPVAGDELIGLLRRINDDSDATIVMAEHRLERCLAAADRVIALRDGRVACDAPPTEFLRWAGREAPNLQTPAARLLDAVGAPPRAGVKAARSVLRERGLLPEPGAAAPAPPPATRRAPRRSRSTDSALELDRVWHELRNGPSILRGLSLSVAHGERVAILGRNGAGKSTLLRHAAGLMAPTRGTVRRAGRVALLLQNPGDYLVHDRVADEAPASALAAVGLAAPELAQRNPRDLSGGEKQRLALAIVLGDLTDPPAVLCLDEPTRGMDRDHRSALVTLLGEIDASVLVATHDPELAALIADRVLLMADGQIIAEGTAAAVLSGGSYFTTETARILGGAGGALTAEAGAAVLLAGSQDPHGVLA